MLAVFIAACFFFHVAAIPAQGVRVGSEAVAEFYLDDLPEDSHLWTKTDDEHLSRFLPKRGVAWDDDCINPESQRQDNMAWNRLENASPPHAILRGRQRI